MKYIESEEVQDFLKKKLDTGKCLFIYEKYLTELPWDWFDTVMFIFSNGIDQNKGAHVLTFDHKETEKLSKIMSLDEIEIFVLSDRKIKGKKLIWNMLLTKEIVEGEKDPKALFIGFESLRKFCDDRNIWYKSMISSKGTLMSGSSLRWLKKEGEDCRKAVNEK